jgi:hypothetical protein
VCRARPSIISEVRPELAYVHDLVLPEILGEDIELWTAKLTAKGVDVVEYTIEAPPGIARPPQQAATALREVRRYCSNDHSRIATINSGDARRDQRPAAGGTRSDLGTRSVRENLSGVIRWVHLGVNSRDFSLHVDEIADAHGITRPDIAASAISQSNFAVSIAQQSEWESVLPGERGIGSDIVKADTENDDATIFESTVLVTEPATLAGSASRIGLGIEPQKNLMAM